MDTKLNTFPLNNRPFLALWLAQLTSQTGLNMLNMVLALLVYEQTHSNAAVSILVLMFTLPGLVLGATSGALVDRFDKKAVLVLVNFIRMLLVLGFLLTSENLPIIFGLSLLLSILTQFFFPAEAATIPTLVGDHPQNLFRANSLFTLTFYVSIVLGFVSGGPAIKIFGHLYVFLFIAALFFVAYLLAASLTFSRFTLKRFIIDNHQNGALGKAIDFSRIIDRIIADLGDGLLLIKQTPSLKMALISLGLVQVLMAVFMSLAPGFAREVLKIDVTDASVTLFGPAVLGLLVGALILNRFSRQLIKRRWSLVLAGMPLAGLSLLGLALTEHLPRPLFLAQGLLFLLGLFQVMVDIPCNTILQEEAGPERRGRVYGLLTTFVTGGSVLPVFFSGVIADKIGVTRVLLMTGLLVIMVSFYLRRQRKQQQAPT